MGRAVVVGAGIGGLAAAIGLRRRGWDVVVLERAPRFAPVGAGLTLMGNGLAALDAIGVGPVVRAAVRPYPAMTIRSRRGRTLARATVPADAPSCGVHRATLHRLLLGALPDDAVRSGLEVVGVADDARPEVTVRSADGAADTLAADLLVGADGVHSVVRRAVWPEASGPTGIGSTAWRGVTRDTHPVRDAEVSWGPGTEVGLVPLEDGRVYWYVSVRDDRIGPADPAGAHADARAHVEGWYPAVVDIVAGSDPQEVVRTELRHLEHGPRSYARGRVALLGDAAHAMPPYIGQGANQALEDAAVLASVAGPTDDVPAALVEYDGQRRPRAVRLARTAVRAGRGGQMVGAAAAVALRDGATALTPSGALAVAMRQVARWQAPVVPVG